VRVRVRGRGRGRVRGRARGKRRGAHRLQLGVARRGAAALERLLRKLELGLRGARRLDARLPAQPPLLGGGERLAQLLLRPLHRAHLRALRAAQRVVLGLVRVRVRVGVRVRVRGRVRVEVRVRGRGRGSVRVRVRAERGPLLAERLLARAHRGGLALEQRGLLVLVGARLLEAVLEPLDLAVVGGAG